ncbi:MAG: hypothetical protein GF399_12765 [Candidatus Coatesbacteria bacterium]|jgi:biopolymer transport protein ExbD|nr:hypothetical protein [Candidatus Coatesbacteria bacterium]
MPGAWAPSKLHKREKEKAELKITSMMDMMTIILVFLLKTFSTQGDISSTQAALTLPESDARNQAGVVDRLAVGENHIFFLDKEVMNTQEALAGNDVTIQKLLSPLEARVKEIEEMQRMANREDDEAYKVLILADRTHYYSLIKRVVATAARAGYLNITVAATQVQPKFE